MEGIFLWETYDLAFKKKVVDFYFNKGMGYKIIAKELGVAHSTVRRWMNGNESKG